jgi:hypothetical protein
VIEHGPVWSWEILVGATPTSLTNNMRTKTNPVWDISREDLEKVVQEHNTYADIFKKFGLPYCRANHEVLKLRLERENISYSKLFQIKKSGNSVLYMTLGDILVEDSTCYRSRLKRRLIKHKLIPYICAICKQEPIWNNKKLTLILDHINGVNNDNRLENLRFLCPNCNSQTDTFGSRNNKRKFLRKNKDTNYFCECGTKVSKPSRKCQKCASKIRKMVTKPNRDELAKLLWEMPTTKIGQKFNVSDKAVETWVKSYQLTKPPRGYWRKIECGVEGAGISRQSLKLVSC